jgi:phosphoglycolate phosphatase
MPPRNGRSYDLVIFDLDGTLVDTAPEIADALNEYLATRGLAGAPFATVRGWIGYGARRLLEKALGAKVTDAEMKAFAEIYLAHCGRNSKPYDGVPETLDSLREQGIRTAVMTNKERRFALPVLSAHGLLERLDDLVFGDSLPEKKPHPLPVIHLVVRAGVAAARSLVVGDSEIDVAAARAAGAAAWAVGYGYGDMALVQSAQPDRIVNEFSRLAGLPSIHAANRANPDALIGSGVACHRVTK